MLVVLLVTVLSSVYAADRMCCRYRCSGPDDCADWCADQETCTIKNGSQIISDPNCRVVHDSKKDQTDMASKEECLNQNFQARNSFAELPFYLESFLYKYKAEQSPFSGIDVRYQYYSFRKLRFRFKNLNLNVCPEHTNLGSKSPCSPRCVEIERTNSIPAPGLTNNKAFLSYDCEVGFYISQQKVSKSWIETTGDTYALSVCSESDNEDKRCGEYIFQMPSPQEAEKSDNRSVIVLIDRKEFEIEDKIVIYVPTIKNSDTFSISLFHVAENHSKSEVYTQTEPVPPGAGPVVKVTVNHRIPSGRYQVAVTPLRGGILAGVPSYSAYIDRPNYGEHTLVIITTILSIILIVGFILGVYKRWQQVAEEAGIEPQLLVSAGRISPRPVLVITSLDNNDHAQIVKEFCVYLREWCGVGDCYYPLDEESGIQCGQRDPWKWAQKSYERIKEKGSILIIAGPNPSLSPSTSQYPGIQDNQIFLATQEMRKLTQQGRLLVMKFPYSDLKSLPADIPAHLVNSALLIPKQMNTLLTQLLQVRKKNLCKLFPFSVVSPDILPRDLTRPGGPQLLNNIRDLTVKEHNWRLEEENSQHNSIIDRFLRNSQENIDLGKSKYLSEKVPAGEDEESRPLCRDTSQPDKQGVLDVKRGAGDVLLKELDVLGVRQGAGDVLDIRRDTGDVLEVRLESGMPSLRQMENRDKSLADDA